MTVLDEAIKPKTEEKPLEFARLFVSRQMGQLLAVIDSAPEGAPEVRLFFSPPKLGVVSVAMQFKDDEEGYFDADQTFKMLDLERCEAILKRPWEEAMALVPATN